MNKIYPPELKDEVKRALSFYPVLKDVHIEFRFNKIEVQSYMLAQPIFKTLWRRKSKRKYQILIRRKYFIDNPQFENRRIPFTVLVGWLGHELGHIVDYKDRSSLNLVWFGFKYQFFNSFLKQAEIAADMNAVKAGMIHELVISKEFGRNSDYFSQSYIDKLNTLYPSVETVKGWDQKKPWLA